MEGIEFPVKLKDLQQFENQNENISINVFKLREPDNVKSFYPVYISKFTNRENNLDLLYLTKDEKIRYCPIKNINRLACKNKNSRQICRKCYKTFSVNKDMNKHRKICN